MSAAAAARRALDGLACGDLAAVLDALDPDLVLVQSPASPWGGEYRGHEGFQEFIQTMMTMVDIVVLESEIHDAGDVAVGRIVTRFTEREHGRAVQFPIVEVYWANNGKLSRIEPYYQDRVALNTLLS